MSKSALGLYIGPEQIVLAKAEPSGGRCAVSMSAEAAVPPRFDGGRKGPALNADLFGEAAELTRLLSPLLARPGWKSRRLVVTLSPQLGLSRYFLMPAVPRRFWQRTVPLESKKYLPFPIDDMRTAFQVLPAGKGRDGLERMGVYFAACPKRTVEILRAAAGALGLDLRAVELADFSAGRVLRGAQGGPSVRAHVHLDADAGNLLLHGGGVPYMSREARWAGKAPESRRLDVAGSIDFAKTQLGVEDIPVSLSGSMDLAAWKEGVKAEGAGEPEELDLAAALSSPRVSWPLLAAAGASLRLAAPGPLAVDLSHAHEKRQETLRVLRAVGLSSGALAAAMMGMAYFAQSRIPAAEKKLAELRARTADIPAFQGLSPAQIGALVDKTRKSAAQMDDVMSTRRPASPWLGRLGRAIPDGVWIEALTYQGQPGRRYDKVLVLEGFALGSDKDEDMALADRFQQRLRKDEAFARAFPECELSFQRPLDVQAAQKRTPFSLRCSKKAPPPEKAS